jgi:hypothetical protein
MQHIANKVNIVHKLGTRYQWGGGKKFELNRMTKQVGLGDNASDLYLKGDWFRSWPGY